MFTEKQSTWQFYSSVVWKFKARPKAKIFCCDVDVCQLYSTTIGKVAKLKQKENIGCVQILHLRI